MIVGESKFVSASNKGHHERSMQMSIVEGLLVIGTFGICTGVWITLAVIIGQNRKSNDVGLQNARPEERE